MMIIMMIRVRKMMMFSIIFRHLATGQGQVSHDVGHEGMMILLMLDID